MDPYLVVIGTAAAWPGPGEACSGYLLVDNDGVILLDCGHGVVAAFQQLPEWQLPLKAVYISHAHPDHCADLAALLYHRVYGGDDGLGMRGDKPELYATAETLTRLRAQAATYTNDGSSDGYFEQAFAVHDVGDGERFSVGKWQMTPERMTHFISAWALRADHASGVSVTYSADLGQSSMQALARLAMGTDVLLCEAAIPMILADDHPARYGHLDPSEAGKVAISAEAKHLLVTHVPGNYHPAAAEQLAQAEFAGAELARSGMRVELNP